MNPQDLIDPTWANWELWMLLVRFEIAFLLGMISGAVLVIVVGLLAGVLAGVLPKEVVWALAPFGRPYRTIPPPAPVPLPPPPAIRGKPLAVDLAEIEREIRHACF